MSDGMKITNAGLNLLGEALQGKELRFMRGVIGDGELPAETDIMQMTELVSYKKDLSIQSIELVSGVGVVEIFLDMSNLGVTQGFWVREFGLIAKDPDTDEEILYAYRNVGNEASYLPAQYGVDTVQYTLDLMTIIDQAENVTAYIASQNNYVTNSHLENRIASLFADSDDINYFWTYKDGDVQKLRPATVQAVKDLIVGQHDYQNLNKRVEVLENVTCQQLLEFESINQYPDYMNFIVEDFKNTSQIDTFSVRVLGAVTGDDSLDLENVSGVIPYSWYTISDGIRSEQVQVQSINRENGINRIILVDPIENTYVLNMCRLYRSSAVMKTGYAEGNSTARVTPWYANIEWHGRINGDPYVQDAVINTSTAGNYLWTGKAGYTSDGWFTLSA